MVSNHLKLSSTGVHDKKNQGLIYAIVALPRLISALVSLYGRFTLGRILNAFQMPKAIYI